VWCCCSWVVVRVSRWGISIAEDMFVVGPDWWRFCLIKSLVSCVNWRSLRFRPSVRFWRYSYYIRPDIYYYPAGYRIICFSWSVLNFQKKFSPEKFFLH
jgi:hypothetical protein